MANKQTTLGTPFSHLERKLQQAFARIAGRARTSIYTDSEIIHNSDGTIETIAAADFSASFLKSAGDSIQITILGFIDIPAGTAASMQVSLIDDFGTLDFFMTIPFTGGPASLSFSGYGHLFFTENKQIRGNSVMLSEQMTPTVNNNRIGALSYNTKNLGLYIKLTADVGVVASIDLFQVEFIPAVIT